MSFPTSHKTVFVMDHMLTASSGVKLEMDSFTKSRSGSGSNSQPLAQPMNLIPLLPVTKSLWTCAVEAITEYCRSECVCVNEEFGSVCPKTRST